MQGCLLLAVACALFGSCIMTLYECPDTFTLYEPDATCLLASPDRRVFSIANNECNKVMGNIVNTNSQAKSLFVNNLFGAGSSWDFWIGVGDFNSDQVFTYQNGSYVGDFQPWVMHPALDQSGNKCVLSYLEGSGNVKEANWITADCADDGHVVCEIPATDVSVPACTWGWSLVPDRQSCHKIVKRKRLSATRAAAYCKKRGGTLAYRLTTRAQRRHMRTLTGSLYLYQFWIGAKYVNGVLTDATEAVVPEPIPFKPRKTHSNKACISMRRGWWYRNNCHEKKFFICAKDPYSKT